MKAFKKVWIEAGKSVSVHVPLDKYGLSFWNEDVGKWVAEKGLFQVIISKSADPEDEVLVAEFELQDNFSWSGL